MKDNLNIEQLLKDKFKNFEADVNPNLWNNISQGINTNVVTAAKTGLSLGVKSIIIGVSVAAIGTTAYLINSNVEKNTIVQQSKELEEEEVLPLIEEKEEKIIDLIEKTEVQGDVVVWTESNSNTSESNIKITLENNNSVNAQETDLEVINEIVLVEKPISEISISNENKQEDLVDKDETTTKKPAELAESITENKIENEQIFDEEPIVEKQEVGLTATIGEIPNVFTPNSDGINDYFMFETENIEAFTVIITDQQDRTVFESNNPKFEWDGRDLGGNLVPNAVYNYFVIAIGADKNMVKTAGQVYVR